LNSIESTTLKEETFASLQILGKIAKVYSREKKNQ